MKRASRMSGARRGAAGRSVLSIVLILASAVSAAAEAAGSRCYGSRSNGRLEGGVSLPVGGSNFSAYSVAGWSLGRAFVHSTVQRIVLDAFAALESAAPGKVFVYGETGWPGGGRFKPHRTHQNGLSVDLMVPVVRDGRSVRLPGNPLNRFGYSIEFDAAGRFEDYTIDFDALAALIEQVRVAAQARDVRIERVIFDVPLQQKLWQAAGGAELRSRVNFSARPAWVRHDEHIHVDFAIACAEL